MSQFDPVNNNNNNKRQGIKTALHSAVSDLLISVGIPNPLHLLSPFPGSDEVDTFHHPGSYSGPGPALFITLMYSPALPKLLL